MMGWDAGFGWMGWFWPVLVVFFWVAVVALAIRLAGGLFNESNPPRATGSTALETIKRRYAAGEITREEYQEGRRLLEG